MSQSTVNPYPFLGGGSGQFEAGLAAIIAGLPVGPQISDLVTQVYNYVITVFNFGATGPTIQQQEEIKSIAYTAINSYVNGLVPSGQSTLSPRAMGFASMLIGPAVTQKVPIYITNWIGDVEDNITKAGLTVDEQRPLLMATTIGTEAYNYWRAQTLAGGSSPWHTYFILNNNDYNSLPLWTAATMEGVIAAYCGNYSGLVETTITKETNTMLSALVGALTISAGIVIFGWIPRIQPSTVTNLVLNPQTMAYLNNDRRAGANTQTTTGGITQNTCRPGEAFTTWLIDFLGRPGALTKLITAGGLCTNSVGICNSDIPGQCYTAGCFA